MLSALSAVIVLVVSIWGIVILRAIKGTKIATALTTTFWATQPVADRALKGQMFVQGVWRLRGVKRVVTAFKLVSEVLLEEEWSIDDIPSLYANHQEKLVQVCYIVIITGAQLKVIRGMTKEDGLKALNVF